MYIVTKRIILTALSFIFLWTTVPSTALAVQKDTSEIPMVDQETNSDPNSSEIATETESKTEASDSSLLDSEALSPK